MAAPAYVPLVFNPATDFDHLGALTQNVQDALIKNFLNWTFRRPSPVRTPAGRRTLPANGPTWKPMPGDRPMAQGGFGLAHLWVKVDANDRIIDRVVVKDVIPGQVQYNHPLFWRDGRVGAEPSECYMANEIYNRLQTNRPGDEKHVTECLGYAHFRNGGPSLWGYKLFFEYAAHGDLDRLISTQRNGKTRLSRRWGGGIRKRRVDVPGRPFPEGFLWQLFEALAKVALEMWPGLPATGTAPATGPMLHGDLHPRNVLLDTPDPNRFRIWPVAKISDWGSARYLFADGDRSQQNEYGIALKWASPEQALDNNYANWEVNNRTLNEKTNVWQIGMIMCCAMRLESPLPETNWRDLAPGAPMPHPILRFNSAVGTNREVQRLSHESANYSNALIRLVRRCMRFDSANRPDPLHLLQLIQTRMAGRLDGMDTRTTRVPWNSHQRLVDPLEDRWMVGDGFP